MTLTPEQREALQAALEHWYSLGDEVASGETIFTTGMRYAYEDAAKICDDRRSIDAIGLHELAQMIRSRTPKDSA